RTCSQIASFANYRTPQVTRMSFCASFPHHTIINLSTYGCIWANTHVRIQTASHLYPGPFTDHNRPLSMASLLQHHIVSYIDRAAQRIECACKGLYIFSYKKGISYYRIRSMELCRSLPICQQVKI